MTKSEAAAKAIVLWQKWVTSGSHFNLDRLHDVILRESRFHATGKSYASLSLIAETKGELIALGKIRRVLA